MNGRSSHAISAHPLSLRAFVSRAWQIAMRLAKSKAKKSREAAKKHAHAAIKLDPAAPMGYVTLGQALSRPDNNATAYKPNQRANVIDALRTALELSDDAVASDPRRRGKALDVKRDADTRHMLATLLTSGPNPSNAAVSEAMKLLKHAEELQPANPTIAETRGYLVQGVKAYQQQLRERDIEMAKKRQKELEATEDAEAEDDEYEF